MKTALDVFYEKKDGIFQCFPEGNTIVKTDYRDKKDIENAYGSRDFTIIYESQITCLKRLLNNLGSESYGHISLISKETVEFCYSCNLITDNQYNQYNRYINSIKQ